MKHIIVTDTHLGLYSSSDLWHSIVLNLFKEVKETANERSIKSIIHAGDFFHDRKQINTKTLNIAQIVVEEILIDFDFSIVIGNHDTYYKNNLYPNSLQLFKHVPNVRLIGEPTMHPKDNNIILCPWNTIPEEEDKYLIGHFEIKGFLMNSTYACKHGAEERSFRNFKHVYSGHFHTPSTNHNITYLGSPYGQTFHDVNSTRGYYVFDSDTEELEFIEFTNAPKFIVIKSEEIDGSKVEGNIVKLIFQKDYGHINNQKLVDDITELNPMNLHVDFSQIKFAGTEEENTGENLRIMGHRDIIREYVEKSGLPDHIAKNTLLSFVDKLLE